MRSGFHGVARRYRFSTLWATKAACCCLTMLPVFFFWDVGVPRSSALCLEAQIGASNSIAAGLVVAEGMLSLNGGGTGQPE